MYQHKYFKVFTTYIGVALLLGACQSDTDQSDIQETSAKEEPFTEVHYDQTERLKPHIAKAYAIIDATEGNDIVGAVSFTEVEGGVRIIADLVGFESGTKHGFHIHEHGDCSAPDASSAGGHFNPTNMKHGGPDSEERHVGDLGNFEANESGFAHYDRIDTVISLNGEHSIIGKSVIIHEGEDDLTSDPTGDAGKRIGCGVIEESKL